MEYKNGVRTTCRYDEMTPLDRAINSLIERSENYFLENWIFLKNRRRTFGKKENWNWKKPGHI